MNKKFISFKIVSLILIFLLIPSLMYYYSNEFVIDSNYEFEQSNTTHETDIQANSQEKITGIDTSDKLDQYYNPSIGNIVWEFCRSCTNNESITKIAFSPNSKYIAGGTQNGKIFIWDMTDGKRKQSLNNSNQKISNLEWTLDSNVLISIGQDSELNYWNVSSGELIKQISVHPKIIDINAIDISNNGKILAIASAEKTVSLWDVNGTFLKFLSLNTVSQPLDIKFSPLDSLIALYTYSGSVLVWNTTTSELKFQVLIGPLLQGSLKEPILFKGNYIDFSQDSKFLFLSLNGQLGLTILDTETGLELPKIYSDEYVLSVSSSKNSNLIITGSDTSNSQIKLYNYKTNKTVLNIEDESTFAVAFSYDESLVASVNAGGTVRIWNIIAGSELYSFKAHYDNIIQTKFLNSSILVSSSKDNTVIVWKNKERLYTISNSSMDKPYAVAITETPKKDILVAIGTDYGKIFLFNSSEPNALRAYAGHEQIPGKGVPQVRWIDFSPNTTLFASSGLNSGYIKVWNSSSTQLVRSIAIENSLDNNEAYFLGNDKIIGGGLHRLYIWDLKTMASTAIELTFADVGANLLNFNFMTVSPDKTVAIATFPFNKFVIVNLTDSTSPNYYTKTGLEENLDFLFTPDNKYLIEVSGEEQVLRIWDVKTFTLLFSTYMDFPNPILADFNPKDWSLVVSYKQDDVIAILNLSLLKNGRLDLLDFDSDGMSDIWEQQHSLQNDNYYDRFEDPDNDKIMNWEEFIDRTNPQSSDTDGDGISDTYEKQYGMNPLINDSNGDIDGDGMSNLYEFEMGLDSSLNDSYFDYDNDGLTNIQEFQYHTDVHKADTDGDGMDDKWEVINGLNPTDPGDALLDNDMDGISNFDEYRYGTDPNNFISVPLLSLNYFYLVIALTSIIVTTLTYYQYRKHLVTKYTAPDYASAVKVRKTKLEDWYQYTVKEEELNNQLKEAKILFNKGLVDQSLLLYQNVLAQALIMGKIHDYAETLIKIYFIEMKLLKGGKDSLSYLNVKYPFKGTNVLLKEYNKIIEGYENESVNNTGLSLELWDSVLELNKVTPELLLIVRYSIIDLQINQFQANKVQELFKEINMKIANLIQVAKENGYPEFICGANILSARLYFNRYNIKNAIESLDKAKEVARKEKLDFYLVKANEEVENFDKIKTTIKKGLSLKDTALEERDFEEYMKQIKDYTNLAKEVLEKED